MSHLWCSVRQTSCCMHLGVPLSPMSLLGPLIFFPFLFLPPLPYPSFPSLSFLPFPPIFLVTLQCGGDQHISGLACIAAQFSRFLWLARHSRERDLQERSWHHSASDLHTSVVCHVLPSIADGWSQSLFENPITPNQLPTATCPQANTWRIYMVCRPTPQMELYRCSLENYCR